ncbi:phage holin family protein [Dongia soli]|uniref:Phage holin family protein n=1 Tax=Dongia soli TaxID=600628 RepID=A0ABU5E553_9PROT|nr:phage holin family protein [Dongia soli]MDY0881412.1 phage holin family protein [Dongia soli]
MATDPRGPEAIPAGPAARLLGVGGRMLSAIIAGVQTRAELLLVEMSAERAKLGSMAALGVAASFAVLLGLVFTSAVVIVYFWDNHRLAAVCAVAAFYWIVAVALVVTLMRKIQRQAPPFAATIDALRRDYIALTGQSPNTPKLGERD